MSNLKTYIKKHFGTQAKFAEAQGVKRQMVTKWINAGVYIKDNEMWVPAKKIRDVKKLD